MVRCGSPGFRAPLEKVCHFVGTVFVCFQRVTTRIKCDGVPLNSAISGGRSNVEDGPRCQIVLIQLSKTRSTLASRAAAQIRAEA